MSKSVSGPLPSGLLEVRASARGSVDGSGPLTPVTETVVKEARPSLPVPDDSEFYTALGAATIPFIERLVREREPELADLIRERDGWPRE
jgi:hypothetical protein